MYTIKQAANLLKVNANAIRFYEKKGLICPQRTESEYRQYTMEDITRLQMILLYRELGFSIQDINELLHKKEGMPLIQLMAAQVQAVNEKLHALQKIQGSLEKSLNVLLEEGSMNEEIIENFKETSVLIAQSGSWRDAWNFDDWAAEYDHDIRTPGDGLDFYKNYDKVLEVTANEVGSVAEHIVEIGIGTGNLTKQILSRNHLTEDKIIGIDQSLNMLCEAKAKLPKLVVKLGTFLQLPCENASCDTIATSYAFHHLNDEEKKMAIIEMDRILKPNGIIIITDLMFESKAVFEDFLAHCSVREKEDALDEYFAKVDELVNCFVQNGYTCHVQQIDALIWCVTARK